MKTAIRSSLGYLYGVAKQHNPIPYAIFKKCIEHQVEWGKSRNSSINPDRLAEVLRKYLLDKDIHVEDCPSFSNQQSIAYASLPNSAECSLILNTNDEQSAEKIFMWLIAILGKAKNLKPESVCFSAQFKKGDSPF